MTPHIKSPNPYGKVTQKEVLEFEKENGLDLPKAYKAYLIANNGANFERQNFWPKAEPEEIYKIADLYSLNCGPSYCRLNDWWSLASYALADFADQLSRYLAIGTASLGAVILLDTKDGSVQLYDPDHAEVSSAQELTSLLKYVARDFDYFVSGLKSDAGLLEDDS